jgi:hypothetical protein
MTPLSRRVGPDLNRDTVGNVQKAGFPAERNESPSGSGCHHQYLFVQLDEEAPLVWAEAMVDAKSDEIEAATSRPTCVALPVFVRKRIFISIS